MNFGCCGEGRKEGGNEVYLLFPRASGCEGRRGRWPLGPAQFGRGWRGVGLVGWLCVCVCVRAFAERFMGRMNSGWQEGLFWSSAGPCVKRSRALMVRGCVSTFLCHHGSFVEACFGLALRVAVSSSAAFIASWHRPASCWRKCRVTTRGHCQAKVLRSASSALCVL